MSNITTTNIALDAKKKLKNNAHKLGISQMEYINASIEYFSKTGINPMEPITSPKDEIARLNKKQDQVISFIRTQESKKLDPLLDNLIILERRLKDQLVNHISLDDINVLEKENRSINKSQIQRLFNGFEELVATLKAQANFENSRYQKLQKREKFNTNILLALTELLINKGAIAYRKEDINKLMELKKELCPS